MAPLVVKQKKKANHCPTACRKRRIKCDEGRPICNNCIKSKRHCEGYNQRVIFKDPMGAHPFTGPFGAQGYIQGAAHPLQLASQQARRPGTTGLPTIAPRPPAYDYYNGFTSVQYQNTLPPGFPGPATLSYDINAGAYPPPSVDPYVQQRHPLAAVGPFPQPQPAQYLQPSHDEVQVELQQLAQFQQHQQNAQQAIESEHLRSSGVGAFVPNAPSRIDRNVAPAQGSASFVAKAGEEAYDWSDEDASIADSDDEDGQHQGNQLMHVFRGLNRRDYHYGGPSPFSRSANDAALGQYMSTPHADELKSEAKRKLFEHFMRVTGPTMSLYERHPFDPAEKAEVVNSSSSTPRETKGSNIWSRRFHCTWRDITRADYLQTHFRCYRCSIRDYSTLCSPLLAFRFVTFKVHQPQRRTNIIISQFVVLRGTSRRNPGDCSRQHLPQHSFWLTSRFGTRSIQDGQAICTVRGSCSLRCP